MDEKVPTAFDELIQLVLRSGYKAPVEPPVIEFVAGPFQVSFNLTVDKHKNSEGLDVEPVSAFIRANGWPLGYVGVFGGALMSSGEPTSTEDQLIAAVRTLPAIKHQPHAA